MQITLIDQNEQFVFKPLLYELINGGATPEEVAPMFADLLAPMNSTSFVQVQNTPVTASTMLASFQMLSTFLIRVFKAFHCMLTVVSDTRISSTHRLSTLWLTLHLAVLKSVLWSQPASTAAHKTVCNSTVTYMPATHRVVFSQYIQMIAQTVLTAVTQVRKSFHDLCLSLPLILWFLLTASEHA